MPLLGVTLLSGIVKHKRLAVKATEEVVGRVGMAKQMVPARGRCGKVNKTVNQVESRGRKCHQLEVVYIKLF